MKQIKIAAILSYISIFLTFAVGIIYTPILIRTLGQSDYGLYSIILALASYLSLLDLGIGNAIVRYIARNKVSGNAKLESDLIGQFFRLFCYIGVITLFIGGILYILTPNIFSNLATENIKIAQIMIAILTVNFALSFPLNVFSAILQANERFVFLKASAIIRILAVPVISIIVLNFGGHLIAMTFVTTVVNLVLLVSAYIYCKVKLNVKMTNAPIAKSLQKEIIIYSSLIFITAIADKIYWQTDQILLGIFTNTDTVAVYAVAIQFTMIFMSLSGAISGLFLPLISKLVTEENHKARLNNLYINISRIQFFILCLTFAGFIILGEDFIIHWAGESFKEAYILVIILMIPFFFDLIQNIGITVLQAKGLNLFRTLSLLVCAVLNIVISIPVIENYGSVGTAVVTATFIAIGNVVILNFYFHKKAQLDMVNYWKNIITIAIPIVILSAVFYFGKSYFYPSLLTIPQWLIIAILFVMSYLVAIFAFCLNEQEKGAIKSRLGGRFRIW